MVVFMHTRYKGECLKFRQVNICNFRTLNSTGLQYFSLSLLSDIKNFSKFSNTRNFFHVSKSPWGEQPVEDIPIFTCIGVYLCVSHLLAKRKTIQTSNLVHTLPKTISKNCFLLFFQKSAPVSRQPRKTAVSRGFSAYLLDFLLSNEFLNFLVFFST